MSRPLRLPIPGAAFHVTARGNAKQLIFLDAEDRRRFLRILETVVERYNVLCHAYCLMGNHYHLLLETPDGNLSLAMRQLNGVYAQTFNRRHGRVGHVFQGRFDAKLIDKDRYLLAVCRYIVRNPVRGKLVERPDEWKWSNYRAQSGLIEAPAFLCQDWILGIFDKDDPTEARRRYREFMARPDENPFLVKMSQADCHILGDREFVARFREPLKKFEHIKEVHRKSRFAARPPLEECLADCRGRLDRNRRIHEAHVRYGYTMAQIADYLGVHPNTVSRAVRSEHLRMVEW